jgi:hypothetical protein
MMEMSNGGSKEALNRLGYRSCGRALGEKNQPREIRLQELLVLTAIIENRMAVI